MNKQAKQLIHENAALRAELDRLRQQVGAPRLPQPPLPAMADMMRRYPRA